MYPMSRPIDMFLHMSDLDIILFKIMPKYRKCLLCLKSSSIVRPEPTFNQIETCSLLFHAFEICSLPCNYGHVSFDN